MEQLEQLFAVQRVPAHHLRPQDLHLRPVHRGRARTLDALVGLDPDEVLTELPGPGMGPAPVGILRAPQAGDLLQFVIELRLVGIFEDEQPDAGDFHAESRCAEGVAGAGPRGERVAATEPGAGAGPGAEGGEDGGDGVAAGSSATNW